MNNWHREMRVKDAIDVGDRYLLPIYKIHSFLMANVFGANIDPRGVLCVERDHISYIPVDEDEIPLDQLFSSIPGLEDLVAELKDSLQV